MRDTRGIVITTQRDRSTAPSLPASLPLSLPRSPSQRNLPTPPSVAGSDSARAYSDVHWTLTTLAEYTARLELSAGRPPRTAGLRVLRTGSEDLAFLQILACPAH